jgi:ABC-type transport system substrate-binding protein
MKQSANGRSWTLTLRKGLKFPDGTPVDASALMYAIDRAGPDRQLRPTMSARLERIR